MIYILGGTKKERILEEGLKELELDSYEFMEII